MSRHRCAGKQLCLDLALVFKGVNNPTNPEHLLNIQMLRFRLWWTEGQNLCQPRGLAMIIGGLFGGSATDDSHPVRWAAESRPRCARVQDCTFPYMVRNEAC